MAVSEYGVEIMQKCTNPGAANIEGRGWNCQTYVACFYEAS
jgi:hypothetical protein